MANEELIEGAPPQVSGSRGPGEILKYERNRSGQSVERISQYLHLSADVVRALEDDRHEDLPEPTYVRGYIRSYARYLELDAEPLVHSYNELIQPVPQAPSGREAKAAPLQRRRVSWVSWGVLLLVAVLMAVWWSYEFAPPAEILRIAGLGEAADVGQTESDRVSPRQEIAERSESVAPEMTASTEDSEDIEIAAVNRSRDIEPEREPETVPKPVSEAVSQPEPEAVSQPVPEAIPQPEPEAVPEGEPETEPSVQVVTADVTESAGQEQEPLPEAEMQTETAATATPAAPTQFELVGRAAPGGDTLRLTFVDQSWTEIYDANNERLLFGLMNSGAIKNVQGTAPFRILLGNSPAVKIQFNGKPFDHSRFDRWDRTARFNVDESSSN